MSMKRELSTGSDLADAGASKKRSFEPEGGELCKESILSYQNFRLLADMKMKKRQLGEAQEELETLRRKSRDMETIVSVIQRAWSQLEIDVSILLDSVGDGEAAEAAAPVIAAATATFAAAKEGGDATTAGGVEDGSAARESSSGGGSKAAMDLAGCTSRETELLLKFLHAGEQYQLADATNMKDITRRTDKWDCYSTEGEVLKQQAAAVAELEGGGAVAENAAVSKKGSRKSNANAAATAAANAAAAMAASDGSVQYSFLEKKDDEDDGGGDGSDSGGSRGFEAGLRERTSFTYSLLERLCNVIMVRSEEGVGEGEGMDDSNLCGLDCGGQPLASIGEGGQDELADLATSSASAIEAASSESKPMEGVVGSSSSGGGGEEAASASASASASSSDAPASAPAARSSSITSLTRQTSNSSLSMFRQASTSSVNSFLGGGGAGTGAAGEGGEVTVIGLLTDAKALHAERLLLRDRLTKLSVELLRVSSQLRISENKRRAAEQAVDKMAADAELRGQEAGSASTSSDAGAASSSSATTAVSAAATGAGVEGAASSMSSEESQKLQEEVKLLQKKVDVLAAQLGESEEAKSKIQMVLSERLGKPLPQTEAQISDMRRAMEQLRTQHKARVASLMAEVGALQQQHANMEQCVQQLEGDYKKRTAEIVAGTESMVKSLRNEKEAVQRELAGCKADCQMVKGLRQQVLDLQGMEKLLRVETLKLKEKLRKAGQEADRKEALLEKARAREVEMEKRLVAGASAGAGEGAGDGAAATAASAASSSSAALLEQAQSRVAEMQAELKENKDRMNDLICEIEAVAASEEKEKETASRLLGQMVELQETHRATCEDNVRFADELLACQQKMVEVQNRLDAANCIVNVRQQAVTQLREEEAALREQNRKLQASIDEHKARLLEREVKLEESAQELKASQLQVEVANARNADLQHMCGTLTADLKAERKTRMDAEMKVRTQPKAPAGSSSSSAAPASVDKDMLDMTLSMLRCYVCRDRFKNTVITRCYHLFCKECIDENLKSRNRKCPACGEKFGQDDVRTVYFTH